MKSEGSKALTGREFRNMLNHTAVLEGGHHDSAPRIESVLEAGRQLGLSDEAVKEAFSRSEVRRRRLEELPRPGGSAIGFSISGYNVTLEIPRVGPISSLLTQICAGLLLMGVGLLKGKVFSLGFPDPGPVVWILPAGGALCVGRALYRMLLRQRIVLGLAGETIEWILGPLRWHRKIEVCQIRVSADPETIAGEGHLELHPTTDESGARGYRLLAGYSRVEREWVAGIINEWRGCVIPDAN
jgi:hypothetical protein